MAIQLFGVLPSLVGGWRRVWLWRLMLQFVWHLVVEMDPRQSRADLVADERCGL